MTIVFDEAFLSTEPNIYAGDKRKHHGTKSWVDERVRNPLAQFCNGGSQCVVGPIVPLQEHILCVPTLAVSSSISLSNCRTMLDDTVPSLFYLVTTSRPLVLVADPHKTAAITFAFFRTFSPVYLFPVLPQFTNHGHEPTHEVPRTAIHH